MNLEHFAGALRRQWFIAVAVLLIGCVVFAWAVALGRTYSATASVLASASDDTTTADPSKDPSSSAIAPQDVPALVRSSPLLAAVARDVHLGPRLSDSLGGRVKTKNSPGSDVISLSVTDSVPERAVATANAFARQLRVFESKLATERYDALIRDLRGQLRQNGALLQTIDGRIAALTENDPYLNAETGATPINTRLVALQQQLGQLQATADGDASAMAVMARRPSLTRNLAEREIVLGDPAFQARRSQFGKDVATRDQTAAGYTSAFPGLAGLNDEVARESKSLSQAERQAVADPSRSATYVAAQLDANKAAAAYAADRAQLAALNAQIEDIQAQLTGSHGSSVQLSSLRRRRDAASTSFAALSQRLATALADRSQAASIGTVVLLDPAVGAAPTLLSRPSVLGILLGAIFAWLAITVALVADSSDSRLRDRGAVERLYGRPVLTTI